ncbi:MAG: hypothetical protein COB07_02270 [Sulfurovum sp.]|nr:MAG: hypothetical protein COB07_02270 [Sulfurovum sp.]
MRFIRFILYILLSNGYVYADALMVNKSMFNPSLAKYFVTEQGIRIELELSEENFESFADLYPNSLRQVMGLQLSPIIKRSKLFLKNKLFIVADEKALVGSVVSMHGGKKIVRDPKTYEVLKPQPKNAPAMLYISIDYPFVSEKPKKIDLIFQGNATLGFILYHKKQVVNDFAYLNPKQTLSLNWEDPFYSGFTSNTLKRLYRYPQMVYLYVEPRLVKLESLTRLKDIVELTSFTSSPKNSERLNALQEHVQNYFREDDALLINTQHTQADKIIVDYFEVSTSGLKILDNISQVNEETIYVGISQQYYVNKLPQDIQYKWQYLYKKIPKIPFSAEDPVGPYPSFIYQDDPVFRWENLIKDKTEPKIIPVRTKTGVNWNLPILGETKVWSELPTQEQSTEIIKQTLENIRTAFIEKREESLSKELSKVLLSESTTVIKKELSKLFTPSVVRGGVGAIEEFGTLSVDKIRALKDADGFSANVSGEVNVIAKHWGHSDRRALKYQLIIDMIEKDGEWFIKDFSLLDLKDKTS